MVVIGFVKIHGSHQLLKRSKYLMVLYLGDKISVSFAGAILSFSSWTN